jgi:preprotein translocase subunit SecF
MGRNIKTAIAILFTITSLYIVGVDSVREFAFPIIIGIIGGVYSSTVISTSVWYVLNTTKKRS